MFEKLGKRAVAAPLAFAIVMCFVFGVIFTPIMRANPSEVPFIIVNLDEGVSMGGVDYNIGETLTEALIGGDTSTLLGSDDEEDGDASSSSLASSVSLVVTQMDTEEDALEALANTDYYGAIVIPENFTSQQISAQVGVGNAASLTIYLNAGKNAQMASTMQTTLASALLSAGIVADIETVNDADIGGGTMASTIGVQIMVVPLYIMCLIMSLLAALTFWKGDATGLRRTHPFAAGVVLVVLVAAFSAAAAGLDLLTIIVAGDLTLPVGELFCFLWACAACIMLMLTGLACLSVPLAALVGVTIMALGMSTALLAAEMLPEFWQTWVYPWAPQAYIGQGLRQIIYFDANPLEGDVTYLIVTAAIGIVTLLLACVVSCVQAKKGSKADRERVAELAESASEPKLEGSAQNDALEAAPERAGLPQA